MVGGPLRRGGVAFVPEDALGLAAVPQLTVLENAVVADGPRYARAGGLALDWAAAREDLTRAFSTLGFTVPSLDAPLGTCPAATCSAPCWRVSYRTGHA